MPQQEQLADQLLPIIREIQLRRQSGTLTVQRGEGATLERGSITFVKGQITQAKTDRRTGNDAFNALSTWRNCYYRFTPSLPSDNITSQSGTSTPSLPELPGASPSAPSLFDRRGDSRASNTPASLPSDAPSNAPYRTRQMDDAMKIIDYRGLSRLHRHLFLLIDGHRTIAELVQLLKHDRREIEKLLRDLERATLISVPDSNQQER